MAQLFVLHHTRSPVFTLLRNMVLSIFLVASLAAHGVAVARDSAAPAMHDAHYQAAHGGEMEMPGPPHSDACCVIGHCLIGLAAEGPVLLPPRAPVPPVPVVAVAALGEPQGNPERPPRAGWMTI